MRNQKTAQEVKNVLIDLYRSKPLNGKRGPYLLTSNAFKEIGNRECHRHAFGEKVKRLLEEDGYTLVDLHNKFEMFVILRISHIEKKLDLLDEYDMLCL